MERDYYRVERAIGFIAEQFPERPSLDEVASSVDLSPYHFQRMFTRWAGVSPKKFMQYLAFQRARVSMHKSRSLFDTALDTGLSGTGRLHDLFISITAMTPGEYQKGGEGLTLNYSVADTLFGNVMVASTDRGICRISFLDGSDDSPQRILGDHFPGAALNCQHTAEHQKALAFFGNEKDYSTTIELTLTGTPFQVKVWEALLAIPDGELRSYSEVAESIGAPTSSRAVGSAVAKNPVAYLIPCHRVIKATGEFGNYRWGPDRKRAMIGREAAKSFNEAKQEDG